MGIDSLSILFVVSLQREKTSQAFRDALADHYKSSNSAKKKRRIQDEPMLYRQLSAPTLNRSAILESDEDTLDQISQASSRSSASSLYSHQASRISGQDEYNTNSSKFMRVEPNMDVLLGELNTVLSLNLDGLNSNLDGIKGKRDIFQSRKSATSVIDNAQFLDGSVQQKTADWFNRSCPDFSYNPRASMTSGSLEPGGNMSSMLNQVHAITEEEEESIEEQFSYPNVYADWHHSTPNLFSSVDAMHLTDSHYDAQSFDNPTPQFKTRPSLAMLSPKKKSQSIRHLNMGHTGSFSVYHSPPKGANRRVNHEDIVLSPIGDGNTDDLFDRLQQIQEFTEYGDGDFVDLIDPISIPL